MPPSVSTSGCLCLLPDPEPGAPPGTLPAPRPRFLVTCFPFPALPGLPPADCPSRVRLTGSPSHPRAGRRVRCRSCQLGPLPSTGINPASLRGTSTGVWVGVSSSDASEALSRDPETLVGYSMIGCQRAMMANRVSFFFDFKGERPPSPSGPRVPSSGGGAGQQPRPFLTTSRRAGGGRPAGVRSPCHGLHVGGTR